MSDVINSNPGAPLTKDLSGIEVSPTAKSLLDIMNGNGRLDMLKRIHAEQSSKDPNYKCISCGGEPVLGTICEVCGAGSVQDTLKKVATIEEPVVKKLLIPDSYQGVQFDSLKLAADFPDLQKEKSFNDYLSLCNSLLHGLNRRELKNMSLFISAPSGFGKMTFAYSFLQLAEVLGYKTFPYLDLLEVKRLIDAYETGNHLQPKFRQDPILEYVGFSDVDLYDADVCILKVPNGHEMHGTYKVMLQVIDRRARRGKTTIILSRYGIQQLIYMDGLKETQGIMSYNNPTPKNLQTYEVIYKRK